MILIATACSNSSSDVPSDATASSVEAASTDTTAAAGSATSDPTGATTAGGTADDGGIYRPAEIDPLSEYVFALCRLDLTSSFAADDPLTAIAAEIEGLPAANGAEQAEIAFLTSALVIAAEADNIVASPEMQQVVNLLRARCN
ncbi:MAG: hypothetical protein WBV89_20825 [Ilumatobacter sp.]